MMYHRGRRADVEQLLRSKGGVEPDPGSLGPLESLVQQIVAESSFPEDSETPEQRKARFIEELRRMEQTHQEEEQ